jgi:hypothetical protein
VRGNGRASFKDDKNTFASVHPDSSIQALIRTGTRKRVSTRTSTGRRHTASDARASSAVRCAPVSCTLAYREHYTHVLEEMHADAATRADAALRSALASKH